MEENIGKLDRKVFKSLLVTYSTSIILDAMDELKGTTFYSSKVMNVLDQYSLTKQRRIYNSSEVSDQALAGVFMMERLIYALTVISEQPRHVAERFDRELEEMFIRYGVNMEDLTRV